MSLLGWARWAARRRTTHPRHLRPPASVPLCPGCGADVRESATTTDDALDRAGARGRTYLCRCGSTSRWDMGGPRPMLLAARWRSR